MRRALTTTLFLLGPASCGAYAGPADDAEIEAHYAKVNRCSIDPSEIACCSHATANLISGIEASAAASRDMARGDWSPQTPVPLDGTDVEVYMSQHALRLCHGASIALDVDLVEEHPPCIESDDVEQDHSQFVRLQFGSDPNSWTSTWVQYNASGRVSASYAGERFTQCQVTPQMRVYVDFRPVYTGKFDQLKGSLGVGDRTSSRGIHAVRWLKRNVELGQVAGFTKPENLRFVSSAGFADVYQVKQYQGACSSASTFERVVDPLALEMLGVDSWAKTLGEASLAIAAFGASFMESWELVFTGEASNESGVAKHRAIGYSKSFGRGVAWVAVPSGESPLLSASADAMIGDFRNPTIAIARDDQADRVIAYTAGGSASHIELGRLKGSGEFKRLSMIGPESTKGECGALAHPALAAQSDGGFVLYFTCCEPVALDCGGTNDATIWRTRLSADLHIGAASGSEPRPVKWDRGVHKLLKEPRYIVSVEAVAAEEGDDVPLWLVLRGSEEGRSVYLTRYATDEKRFKLHSEQPVLAATTLCEDVPCGLDSVSFTRSDQNGSVVMVAVVSSGAGAQSHSSLYMLSQRLGALK